MALIKEIDKIIALTKRDLTVTKKEVLKHNTTGEEITVAEALDRKVNLAEYSQTVVVSDPRQAISDLITEDGKVDKGVLHKISSFASLLTAVYEGQKVVAESHSKASFQSRKTYLMALRKKAIDAGDQGAVANLQGELEALYTANGKKYNPRGKN